MRQQILVGAAACHFAEQIDVPGARRQRKVQPPDERVRVPPKRQPGGSSTKVGIERPERADQPCQILRVARVDDVEIVGGPSRAMKAAGNAADDDKVNRAPTETGAGARNLSRLRPCPTAEYRHRLDEILEPLEALCRRQLQGFAKQRAVDVFLVCLDDRVRRQRDGRRGVLRHAPSVARSGTGYGIPAASGEIAFARPRGQIGLDITVGLAS